MKLHQTIALPINPSFHALTGPSAQSLKLSVVNKLMHNLMLWFRINAWYLATFIHLQTGLALFVIFLLGGQWLQLSDEKVSCCSHKTQMMLSKYVYNTEKQTTSKRQGCIRHISKFG